MFVRCVLSQRSPTFLAPGTGFVEDNFSTHQKEGRVQAVMRAMESNGKRHMKLPLLTHHCSPPAVQPGS